jgi:class 3 adenylate cyclase
VIGDAVSGTATVLFTDLVGSTELMVALGDTAFDGLRGDHFRRLERAVVSCRGVQVKNTGDGILATFSSAVDALAAGVAVQQATERHARTAATPFSVRVGLAIGEVAFKDGDVFGTPVVEAARLVAAARPGQILCSALVRTMAGSRAGVAFTEVGPLTLKGLPDPLPVCGVAWEATEEAPAQAAMPPQLAGGRIFVGRHAELERLQQRWKEAAAGERRLVLLGGEPGVGKTRLATELAQGLHADGAVVLAGRCDEDLGVPYQPFVEALRHYVTHAGEPRLGRHGGELVRLVPHLSDLVPGLHELMRSDPETERYRLFDAVAAWLGAVSGETPVLLVLDDLHWAAKPTVLLLRHVLRSPEALRLLVVATYRDTDLGRGNPLTELLADVPRFETAERLPVVGLDVPAVGAFLEQAANHDLGDEGLRLAQAVWRETEGNAFFVAEVQRHLVESGAIAERDGRWALTAAIEELGIPEGVRDVVGRRLSRLSEEANRVLRCASVAGLEFEPRVVQRAGAFPEDAVISALEEATASRLVVEVPGPVPRNRFAHALVRATLYDEMSAARRFSLHRKVAEAIEGVHAGHLDDHLPALAHHWARASAPAAETDRAVDYAARAGDRALAQLAHDDAAGYYRQALDLLDAPEPGTSPGARRVHLLISLGVAQRRAGDPAHRETLLDAGHLARDRGDAPALARAALANTRGFMMSLVDDLDHQRIAALEAALDLLSSEDSELRARVLAHLAVEQVYAGDWETRVALSDEGLAMARRLGDAGTLADVLLSRFYVILAPSTLEERRSNTAQLIALAEELGDDAMMCQASWQRMRTALEGGDFAGALRCLEVQERLSAELGEPSLRLFAALSRTGPSLAAGRIEEAEQAALAAFALAETVDEPNAAVYLVTQLLHIRFEQGRLGEMEDSLRGLAEKPSIPSARAGAALAACELGKPGEARQFFDPLVSSGFTDMAVNSQWMWGMTNCADVCAALGDASAARMVHALLAPHADQFVTLMTMVRGSVAHYLGLLATVYGDFDEAGRRFEDAAAAHARVAAPGWLARTRLEWARMLTRRGGPGDPERARQLADEALSTAEELGMAGVATSARELLHRARPMEG